MADDPVPSISGLNNTTYEETFITWEWTDPVDENLSHVEIHLDGSFMQNVSKGVKSYNATDLEPDTEYEIGTHTVNLTGYINPEWVNHTARTKQTDTTPPASITGLINTTYEETSITWTWTDPEDDDFSHVEIYLDGLFKENVSKAVESYHATGLNPDTEYEIGTHTVDLYGNINPEWVNHIARTQQTPDTTPPASISGLINTTYEETSITWTWTDPTDDDFSHVEIYLDGLFKENVSKAVESYHATGLNPDTEYEIGTHTVDLSGNINPAWVNHIARTQQTPDTTPPASITGLINTTYEETSITWTWTDPADDDFSHVEIYLDGLFKENVSKAVESYHATGLNPDTEYEIGTHTVDLSGNINPAWVNHIARTQQTPDTTPPASITGLINTTYEETSITWTWTDSTDADFSHVEIYLDGLFKENVSKAVESYHATGLNPDTEYEIGTHTVDLSGNINPAWVNHIARTQQTPDTTPPASISELISTTNGDTYITWTWTDPEDDDFSHVKIYLDGSFKEDVSKDVESYTATGLDPDTEYEISTHTVDLTGNINPEWVNHTAKTKQNPITINITSPANGFSTTSSSILVTGFVDGDDSTPNVTVNGIEAELDLDVFAGNYSVTIPLSIGNNPITVTANTSAYQKSVLITITRTQVNNNNNGGGSSGGSSSGGGGGGTSGEAFANILISETKRENVYKDTYVSYYFKLEDNIVRNINFSGLSSSGKVAAKVEILKNTSTLVDILPPDMTYKNLNIWIGNMGWATPQNIADPTISFKVDKSWLIENNIDKSTIKMNRYNDNKWNTLETSLTDQDDSYLYFTSKTPGFSPFAITGKQVLAGGAGIADNPTAITEESHINNPAVIDKHVSEENDKAMITILVFSLFAAMVILLTSVQLTRKNNKMS